MSPLYEPRCCCCRRSTCLFHPDAPRPATPHAHAHADRGQRHHDAGRRPEQRAHLHGLKIVEVACLVGRPHHPQPSDRRGVPHPAVHQSELHLHRPAEQAFLRLVNSRTWTLGIIDGVTESLALEGLEPNANAEIAAWLGRIPRRLARTGAATAVIDHVAKNPELRGRWAIGAQHKLAGVDGCSIIVELLSPLSRADNEPVTGRARLVVAKDRPGWVRQVSTESKIFGTLEITAFPDHSVDAQIVTDANLDAYGDLEIVAEIAHHLTTYGRDSESRILRHLPHPEALLIDAIRWMVDNDWIIPEKKGNSMTYDLTAHGRTEMEQ